MRDGDHSERSYLRQRQIGLTCLCSVLNSLLRDYSTHMDRNEILEYLNAEITRLTTVRDLMSGEAPEPRRRGRPKGSVSRATNFNPEEFTPEKRRTMSPEGKARVAAAQKKRWAAQKSDSAKKTTPVKASSTRKSAPVAKTVVAKAVHRPAGKKAAVKKAVAKKGPAPAKAIAPVKVTPAAEQ